MTAVVTMVTDIGILDSFARGKILAAEMSGGVSSKLLVLLRGSMWLGEEGTHRNVGKRDVAPKPDSPA